jgi:flagellar biogenesis protein FliO
MQACLLSPSFALVESTFGGTGGPDLSRYLMVVGVLIGILVALAWGFRRLVGGSLRTRAGKRSLQVLEVLPLGGRRQLAIVRCYDRTFALGVGEKEVGLVAELDSVEAPAPASADESDEQEAAFRALLDRAHARLNGQRKPANTRVRELLG